MSACSRKRKLDDSVQPGASPEDATKNIDSPSPRKKAKLDDGHKTDLKENETIQVVDTSFDIKLGEQHIIGLFASNTVNNDKDHTDASKHGLSSLKVGVSNWKFEFHQLPTDPKHDIYQFLDGLFGDKLCDWKEYINKDNCDKAHKSSNNFVFVIKDGLGVWRGAILFIVYELHWKKENLFKYLIKIPLAGVDLHFRRQNVGSVLVNYSVSMIHKIMESAQAKYEIIVLVIDDTQAKSFWTKNNFNKAVECKAMEHCHIFDKDLMTKKGFVLDIESELIVMAYTGVKDADFVLNHKMVNEFVTPKYVNFGQRYCKKHEIEEHEKDIKEWEKKKKELEEKQKQKKDDDDDDSDEDFDIEAAKQLLSSDEDHGEKSDSNHEE